MAEITPGSRVLVRSADNRMVERRAVTGAVDGDDFLVVWVCHEDEWEAARAQNRPPNALPWPAEDVQVAGEPGIVTAA